MGLDGGKTKGLFGLYRDGLGVRLESRGGGDGLALAEAEVDHVKGCELDRVKMEKMSRP